MAEPEDLDLMAYGAWLKGAIDTISHAALSITVEDAEMALAALKDLIARGSPATWEALGSPNAGHLEVAECFLKFRQALDKLATGQEGTTTA